MQPDVAFAVRIASAADAPAWRRLRHALWPHASNAEHARDIAAQLDAPHRYACFVAVAPAEQPLGFAEIAVRNDAVNGCHTSPVLFLEGVYVDPSLRRRGIARSLIAAAAAWGATRGCSEFASDAPIDNAASYALHRALGFDETERVVFFRRTLPR
ncbi:aminoglycoside 6'-N-acetyltransferase [Burkholderia sp. TSV86]|uniref:aminoglycoside 6'-N-acetyltransferase n=1 Tax=Burkholderia sp. TSV86 TaxID=1385594 RepID=UPI000757CA68|nr:aminoglycoside 6'-N-acetyltransferase [Burkholderia sp. TSV86]KVE35481.1 aminoglycoside 6'-acetyltransferase [Burkholderia sp. TSV86]